MDGYPTPEDAASHEIPRDITHVVETRYSDDGKAAYVLLAIEVGGTGYHLDETICTQSGDGSWETGDGGDSGYWEGTLAELRTNPPMPSLVDARSMQRR